VIAAAKQGVDQAAAMVADARVAIEKSQKGVAEANRLVDDAATEVDAARADAALNPQDKHVEVALREHERWLKLRKDREAELADSENMLNFCDAWLRNREAELAKARSAHPSLDWPAGFRPVGSDVARKQLGAFARSRHFEVPTRALEEVERHVRTLRELFGMRHVTKSAIPNLVVAAAAGAGQTTLLRYLQQTADTVRNGAELQADTNWVVKGWGTASFGKEKDASTQLASPLRHVFVGFATFNDAEDVSFEAEADTESGIERRCAWRILHDAGLVPKWTPNFGLGFTQAAERSAPPRAARRMRSRSSFSSTGQG
jgi:hypothetical protein